MFNQRSDKLAGQGVAVGFGVGVAVGCGVGMGVAVGCGVGMGVEVGCGAGDAVGPGFSAGNATVADSCVSAHADSKAAERANIPQ